MASAVKAINQIEFTSQPGKRVPATAVPPGGKAQVTFGSGTFNFDSSFPLLASADFDNAVTLAQAIRKNEASVLAQLAVARGALRRPPGASRAAKATVVATVNGEPITSQEIDEPIKASLDELRRQADSARVGELQRQIEMKLLEGEARTRAISLAELTAREITSKTAEPADAEARAFYEQNARHFSAPFVDVKTEIIAHLRDARQREETKKVADRLRAAAQVQVLVEQPTAPETPADRVRVVAMVNGEPITAGDVEGNLSGLMFNLQVHVYHLRKSALDSKIRKRLVDQEARRRNSTVQALLESEVQRRLNRSSDRDARSFYEQNQASFSGEYATVRDRIFHQLQAHEEQKAKAAFVDELWRTASIHVFLVAPEAPPGSSAPRGR